MTKHSHRVLILAAGEGSRWGNYRSTPKHLAIVEGQPLLHRTVGQFKSYTDDIFVVASDAEYKIEGVNLLIPVIDTTREMNKFDSSMHMWASNKRTIIIFGDVYFTDEAVRTIMFDTKDWRFYLRPSASFITGKNCKEIFGLSFEPSSFSLFVSSVNKLKNFKTTAAGWSLFRLLTLGTPSIAQSDPRMYATTHHTIIDDWTEDFDYPNDLDLWESKRKASNAG